MGWIRLCRCDTEVGFTPHYYYYCMLLLLLLLLLVLHSFNGLFSSTTWVSRYQKGKTSLDLNEARDGGFGDAVASAGPYADNLAIHYVLPLLRMKWCFQYWALRRHAAAVVTSVSLGHRL